jgi:hypothetical protein
MKSSSFTTSLGKLPWACPLRVALVLLGLAPIFASAATLTLIPSADTTLIETAPSNNLGGQFFFNTGVNQNHKRTRALIKFDIAGQLPPGALIQSAALTLTVIKQPPITVSTGIFSLTRVFLPWGEGNKSAPDAAGPGVGQPATTNEASWTYRFAFTPNFWGTPGGQQSTDFALQPSAEQVVMDVANSPYTFASTPRTISDVQLWLDHPEQNFGWMLQCTNESEIGTVRRFGSRENTNSPPRLAIQYSAPPRLTAVRSPTNALLLQIEADPGQQATLQMRSLVNAGEWITLSNLISGIDQPISIPFTNRASFFRVIGF